jgi:pimeloyl-ACP methyl ester carboxylesterase
MVRKLILVGSGPFQAHYAERIMPTRASRVPPENRDEVYSLIERLESPDGNDKDPIVARLGELMSKTDHFEPLRLDLGIPDCEFLGEVHAKVWPEGSALRKSGELLEMANRIRCPVVAIHGDYDPHPAEGVEKPLSAVLSDFRFILLENCGHEPWIERRARDEFFRILRQELR